MLVSSALGDANFSRHLTQNPQRESVEYRLRWVPSTKSSRWPCTFHVVCVSFICVRWPTQMQFSVEYGLYDFCSTALMMCGWRWPRSFRSLTDWYTRWQETLQTSSLRLVEIWQISSYCNISKVLQMSILKKHQWLYKMIYFIVMNLHVLI